MHTQKTDPYEPFKYTSKLTKLTPKSLNTDLTKQEQKLVIEKIKKVEDKVKWSKSNKEDTIKKVEELKGGESESMTGSKNQCKSYSFKGKTKKKHLDSEHESNLTCNVCGRNVL